MASPRFTITKEDIKRVLKNAFIFLGPALLVALADLTELLPEKLQGIWLVVGLYVLNIVTDFVRKFISENKYK